MMNNKSYIFIYNNSLGTREEIKCILDSLPEILHWRFELPYTFFLVSEETANGLAKKIQKVLGDNGKFLLSEYSENSQGLLSEKSWRFLESKEPSRPLRIRKKVS